MFVILAFYFHDSKRSPPETFSIKTLASESNPEGVAQVIGEGQHSKRACRYP